MATGSVAITAGSGTPIRIVTNAAVDGGADQQVFTLADAAGNLLGTSGTPIPVATAGDLTVGTITNRTPTSVTTTAASVVTAGTYRAIVFDNQGTDYVYIGATGVTSGSYFKRIAAGETLALTSPFVPGNAIYAVANSGTQTLAIGVLT